MSHDAEKRAEEMLNKLRKLKGLCPMTPDEADAAYDAAQAVPLSQNKIRSIVESVTSGELTSWEPIPELDWAEEMDIAQVEDESLQLYRNKGEDDDETAATEDELREELLSDNDETEGQDGVDGGTATPPTGG